MPSAASLFGVASPFDSSNKLVTSPFFSPPVLACLRLLIAVYTMAALIYILAYDGITANVAGNDFAYFTILTYIGICSYYWASFVQTALFVRRERKWYPLQNWPKVLQVLHLMLQATITTFPIVVTIAFWSLIADATTLSTPVKAWRNISIHILNTVFCLFEILCTNSPPAQWIYLPFMVLLIGLYTAYAYVYHATQGFYAYTFLDPAVYHGKVAAYFFGIVVGEAIIFSVVFGVIKLREKLFPVKKPPVAAEMKEYEHKGHDSV